ncbi:hypothetical protein BV25DRAFT_1955426 [Artomyces pyxidatus]|uniref:Uncharacterized protein n=1 Tax=Artomyces pyxidatus TaxID=48021 RepID=A0ACB8SWZ1_9AGAM|nr:hypothetical protein BV25DRAFT_1955426 [Artomyces pyxidatus]
MSTMYTPRSTGMIAIWEPTSAELEAAGINPNNADELDEYRALATFNKAVNYGRAYCDHKVEYCEKQRKEFKAVKQNIESEVGAFRDKIERITAAGKNTKTFIQSSERVLQEGMMTRPNEAKTSVEEENPGPVMQSEN